MAELVEKTAPIEDAVRNIADFGPEMTDKVRTSVRSLKRTIRHGREAAEDAIGEAQRQIKRRPFQAVGAAFLVGMFAAGVTACAMMRRR